MKFTSIKIFFSHHRYAIGMAIIVACIAGLPQVVVRHKLGTADRGIPYLVNDSEGEYLGRIHEILDGHSSVSSPALYEYKNSIATIPPTGEFIFYALPVKLTGLSLNTIVFLSKLLYPAFLFFLAYLFISSLLNRSDTEAKLSAIVGGLLVAIGYDLDGYRNIFSTIIHGSTDASGLLWNRLVNPITGGILLFAFFLLLSRVVSGKSGWSGVVISGLILSVMSGYIFSFALALTVPVLMGFYFVGRKNWPMVKRVYLPVVIALGANAFYFLYTFWTRAAGVSFSDPRKSGMLFTHEPLLNLISLAALSVVIICFVVFFRKDTTGELEKRWWFFSLATVIACEFVYNQQIITGVVVWPQHFTQYTKILVMAIMVVFLHNIFRSRVKNMWRATMAVLFITVALFGWRGFEAAAQNTLPKYTDLQSFSGVFEYLNANAPKDCVVYVSSDYRNVINRFIPALTRCNVYHSYYIYSGVPVERIMHNFLVDLRLRDIKPKDIEKYFEGNRWWIQAYFFRDWNDMFCCRDTWLGKIGDKSEIDQWYLSVEKDVEQRYAEYLKGDLYTELTKYRLDYFVVDTEKQPQVNDKRYPFLSFKGQFGHFAVYAVVKP